MKAFLIAVAVLLAAMAAVPFWAAWTAKRQLANLQRAIDEISAERGPCFDLLDAEVRKELGAHPWKLRDCKMQSYDASTNGLLLRCPNDDRVHLYFEGCEHSVVAAFFKAYVCDPPAKLNQVVVH